MSRRTSRSLRVAFALAAGLAAACSAARAEEIHLDCARPNQSVAVDVDTNRLFVQMMWDEGVAEEYQNGDSYISGPSASGRTEKVTSLVSVAEGAVIFGQDRTCIESGSNGTCRDKHSRNTLDTAAGVLKFDDGGVIALLKCVPAPPSRRF
jgi:hypothetical protein